jgi:hypothetical protein
MKKIILLGISILMVTAAFAQTGNPIPSYNVPVSNGSYFEERTNLNFPNYMLGDSDSSKEKRDMNVSNEGSAGGGNNPQGPDVVVYIYKLGGDHKVLGPFEIPAGTTLTVPIDHSNRWGVDVVSNCITYMSVWTNDNH